jgi:hypothetical protein
LNFQNLNNFNHFLDYLFNLDYLYSFVSLSNDFFTDLFDCHNFLLNHWNFNSVLNNLDYLLDQGDNLLNYTFHFFYSISIHYFLFNYFNFLNSGNLHSYFNNFLYNFNYFFDLFNCLNDWNNLLNNSFDNLRNMLDIIDHFSCWFVGNCVDNLLNNPLYFDNDGFFNHSFNNLFYNLFNFFDFFYNFLDNDSFMPNNLYLFDLRNWMINNFLNYNSLFFFDNLFFDNFNFNNLGNLNPSFDNFLNYLWNLNNFFFYLFDLDNFFDYSVNVLYDLHRHMDYLFNFLYLGIIDYLFHNFLNRHNCLDFDHTLHNLFNNLRNLHNPLVHLEDFQDIIN